MPLYEPLPAGSARLLRLLPHADKHSTIQCQLFTCSLLDSENTHPYEALSYQWGSEENQKSIGIGHYKVPIRANLHAALSHLRDRFIDRVIWIDAICINQENYEEKAQQVQSMAKIYAKATRVVVWLGEAADNSSLALEAIRKAANQRHASSAIKADQQATLALSDQQSAGSEARTWDQPILALLERAWFQRVWVLQEVAAARHILMKCGLAEIDGYAFCSGLTAMNMPHEARHLQSLISPMLYLIGDAIFRPRYGKNNVEQPERFSLSIRPLSELMDMYHAHKATITLDKIYALIGMSSDDPEAAGLKVNYKTPWRDLFQKLIYYSLSHQTSVSTWDSEEVAVIEARGCVLGEVSFAREDATLDYRQRVEITWDGGSGDTRAKENHKSCSIFQAPAKTIRVGDIVCLLQGASRPTIIRLHDGISTIVTVTVPERDDQPKWLASVTTFPTDLLLVWDWDEPRREDYAAFISGRGVPRCPRTECQCREHLDKATMLWNFGILLNRVERYEEAVRYLREAVDTYKTGAALIGGRNTYPGSYGVWREVDEKALKIMDDMLAGDKGAVVEAEYREHGRSPLWWAIDEGGEAVVRLLADNSANVDARDEDGQTPLSRAAANGRETAVKVLVATGKAHVDAKDRRYGRAPLSWAAEIGHEAIAKLLLAAGRADVDLKDSSGRTPLSWAATNGHEAVVKLLLSKGAAVDLEDDHGRTPLWQAANNRQEVVVGLLLDEGASADLQDNRGQVALARAAANGCEGTVRLLLDKGAAVDSKDDYDLTVLLWAAGEGHEAVVRLLLDRGATVDLSDDYDQTALSRAAAAGHEGVVRLLLDRGAAIRAQDCYGWTALSWASRNGHEAVVRLLLDKGAVADVKDSFGRTALSWAAENRHGAIAELLQQQACPHSRDE